MKQLSVFPKRFHTRNCVNSIQAGMNLNQMCLSSLRWCLLIEDSSIRWNASARQRSFAFKKCLQLYIIEVHNDTYDSQVCQLAYLFQVPSDDICGFHHNSLQNAGYATPFTILSNGIYEECCVLTNFQHMTSASVPTDIIHRIVMQYDDSLTCVNI